MALQVKHVMRTAVMAVAPNESLHVASRLMRSGDLRHLPVVKGNAVLGVLTYGDILRSSGRRALGRERGVDAAAALRGLRVQEAMSKPAVTIGPDASVNEAVELLLRHGVKCLPVLADGRLIGLFTERDLLRAIDWPRDEIWDRRASASSALANPAPSQARLEASP